MSLLIATLITAFLLIGKGAFLWFKPALNEQYMQWLLRSKTAAYIFFGGAVVWFLWIVLHLGEADFGQYRYWLFILFLGLGVSAFYFVPDFLGVRGVSILGLLVANILLDAAYMEVPMTRLFLVCLVYVFIVGCMYIGAVPYKLRDFKDWMFAKPERARWVAASCMAYGVVLLITAATY